MSGSQSMYGMPGQPPQPPGTAPDPFGGGGSGLGPMLPGGPVFASPPQAPAPFQGIYGQRPGTGGLSDSYSYQPQWNRYNPAIAMSQPVPAQAQVFGGSAGGWRPGTPLPDQSPTPGYTNMRGNDYGGNTNGPVTYGPGLMTPPMPGQPYNPFDPLRRVGNAGNSGYSAAPMGMGVAL